MTMNLINSLARQAKVRADVLLAVAKLPHGEAVQLLRQIANDIATLSGQSVPRLAAVPASKPEPPTDASNDVEPVSAASPEPAGEVVTEGAGQEVPAPADPPRARDGRKYPVRVFQAGERREKILAVIRSNPQGALSAEIMDAFNARFDRVERGRVYSSLHEMKVKYKILEQDAETKRYRLRAS